MNKCDQCQRYIIQLIHIFMYYGSSNIFMYLFLPFSFIMYHWNFLRFSNKILFVSYDRPRFDMRGGQIHMAPLIGDTHCPSWSLQVTHPLLVYKLERDFRSSKTALLRRNWHTIICTYLNNAVWEVFHTYIWKHHCNSDNEHIHFLQKICCVSLYSLHPTFFCSLVSGNHWSTFFHYRFICIF